MQTTIQMGRLKYRVFAPTDQKPTLAKLYKENPNRPWDEVRQYLTPEAKAYLFSDFTRDTNVFVELTKVAAALGIHRTRVYHGINEPETFEPVGIAIRRIADCIDERLARMKRRQAA